MLAAVGASALAACSRAPSAPLTTTTPGAQRHPYGADPSQYGELHRPGGSVRAGTVVVIHGGFWYSAYGADLGTPLARDLAQRGYTAWNLEYRRTGNGGDWPATFDDVAAGIDALAGLDVDTSRVVAVGHSAGGHLAAWAAARPQFAAGAPGVAPKVRLTGVISQAGVLDLTRAARQGLGGSAVPDLLGGQPDAVPERYAIADPIAHLPLGVPVRCVHSRKDANVPFDQSASYVAAAVEAGDDATVTETTGDHFTLIDPTSQDWTQVVGLLAALMG